MEFAHYTSLGRTMRNSNDRNLLFFVLITAYVAFSFTPFFILDNTQHLRLVEENGIYQTLTAVAFLAASILLALTYALEGNGNHFGRWESRRNIFVLLLAIVLFIGAGEELSWGQHLLGFDPPEAIAKYNRQGELNIHNLFAVAGRNADGAPKTGLDQWLTVGKLFSLFWLGYCVCIPLLAAVSSRVRRFLDHINLAIVPLWIGLVFPINHLLSKFVVQLSGADGHYVVEVKESNFAVLFGVFGLFLYFQVRSKRSQ